MLFKDNFKFP